MIHAKPRAYITNFWSDTVSVIDMETDTVIKTIPVGDGPFGVATSPDGRRAFITNVYSGDVSVINTILNVVIATISVAPEIHGITSSVDGSKLYVTSWNVNDVLVIDSSTLTVTASIPLGPVGYGIVPSPDGTKLFVSVWDENSVAILDTEEQTITTKISVGTNPAHLVINPDGSRVYVQNYHGSSISVLNTATNSVMETIDLTQTGYLAMSPDGHHLWAGRRFFNGQVSIIDTTTNTITASVPAGTYPTGLAFSPDGAKIYVANDDSNDVTVIDANNHAIQTTISVGDSPVAFGNFVADVPISVSVEKTGSGTGSVRCKKPAGIDCGSLCEAEFPAGTALKLKAKPDNGSVFKEWSGVCAGVKKDCAITVEQGNPKLVIATFIREPTIKVSPGSKSFRSVRAGSDKKARFTVKNKTTKGKQSLNIGQISILSRVFAIIAESDGCSNTSLGPGGSCRFEVQFSPIMQGLQNSTIEIPSNDPDAPLTIIPVAGEGI
jgi:YVTN family beta-propeller protein